MTPTKLELREPSEERVVKHKVFRYYLEQEDPLRPGQAVTVQHLAQRGETVNLRDVDAALGDKLGAFYTDAEIENGVHLRPLGEPEPQFERAPEDERVPEELRNREAEPADVDLTTLDEDAISAWLQGSDAARKPSIPQVVAAVERIEDEDDRAAVASAVIAAERSVPDRDARSSLVEKLDAYTEE